MGKELGGCSQPYIILYDTNGTPVIIVVLWDPILPPIPKEAVSLLATPRSLL